MITETIEEVIDALKHVRTEEPFPMYIVYGSAALAAQLGSGIDTIGETDDIRDIDILAIHANRHNNQGYNRSLTYYPEIGRYVDLSEKESDEKGNITIKGIKIPIAFLDLIERRTEFGNRYYLLGPKGLLLFRIAHLHARLKDASRAAIEINLAGGLFSCLKDEEILEIISKVIDREGWGLFILKAIKMSATLALGTMVSDREKTREAMEILYARYFKQGAQKVMVQIAKK